MPGLSLTHLEYMHDLMLLEMSSLNSQAAIIIFSVFKFFSVTAHQVVKVASGQTSSHLSHQVNRGLSLRDEDQEVPSIYHCWYYTTLLNQLCC